MSHHIDDRHHIIDALRQELVGPSPQGIEIEASGSIRFATSEQAYLPYRQAGSGEEILQRDAPTKRYGIGVLYPSFTAFDEPAPTGAPATETEEDTSPPRARTVEGVLTDSALEDLERVSVRVARENAATDFDDFDLSTTTSYKPSTMAVSFLASLPEETVLVVEAKGGRYAEVPVIAEAREFRWWRRVPVTLRAEFSAAALSRAGEYRAQPSSLTQEGAGNLDLKLEVFSRPAEMGQRLLTVALVNRTGGQAGLDVLCLFQASMTVTVASPANRAGVLPYPGPPFEQLDEEEQSLALLYRDTPSYAVGHGCAADWAEPSADGYVKRVSAECLPYLQTPSITPEVFREDRTSIEVPMANLAGLVAGVDGLSALLEVVKRYEAWIKTQALRASQLSAKYQPAAERHLEQCKQAARRMHDGLAFLQRDPKAYRAFQLANHAILLQQLRTRRESRLAEFDAEAQRFSFSAPYEEPDLLADTPGRGKWRPFQVAFLLAALASTADGENPDRRTVELIWFPTGGGKTEAYLGLAAFAIFLRRLKDEHDRGVEVLMRYTLRLLTAQQFQRAAGLLCAMEYLRRQLRDELGETEFSIGIWLGGETTPNSRQDALDTLRELTRGTSFAQNKFILTRCPWCGAQLGPVGRTGRQPKNMPKVIGYEQRQGTVALVCPDGRHCAFGTGLPVYVIDDDIYDRRPDLLIGTVDKFAQLAWDPRARAIFGLAANGHRMASPPGLILQDELHLISGPLGSMVGLYEAVIEELCTDRRVDPPSSPKIVSSTATIRRYAEQIRALYARDQARLFPPPGLDAGDSFFAQYARHEDGTLRAGRVYLGVHAPGLGSVQTAQVRTFAALLQAPVPLSASERDPWWTLLVFFNSLRELGSSLSLLQSDIPDYLRVIKSRCGLDDGQVRRLWQVKELTGRMRSDEVPEAIGALEVPTTSAQGHAVDVCLASSIIEVGVDIDRLSLMTVVGQPKTTAQYIQVTGRVGRRWWERPGLVVTIYGASKPRDRSHFEQFRSYHERLYAQVEPTSVTPFSPPALDRALHAAIVSYVRQAGNQDTARSPYPFPEALVAHIERLLMQRLADVDPEEASNFQRVLQKRKDEWQRWQRVHWRTQPVEEEIGLLRPAGEYATAVASLLSWATPRSLRNVDAECQADIVQPIGVEGGTNHA